VREEGERKGGGRRRVGDLVTLNGLTRLSRAISDDATPTSHTISFSVTRVDMTSRHQLGMCQSMHHVSAHNMTFLLIASIKLMRLKRSKFEKKISRSLFLKYLLKKAKKN
jgi:hypothetical protein